MFSATDVANFLACHHLLTLDRAQLQVKSKSLFSTILASNFCENWELNTSKPTSAIWPIPNI